MSYTPSFNYQELEDPARRRLTVNFGLNDKTLREILAGEYDHLYLLYGDYSDLSTHNLDSITAKWVQISQCENQNINWVSQLSQLESFSTSIKLNSNFDFSNLRNLKCFGGPYGKAVERLTQTSIPLSSFGSSSFKGEFSTFDSLIKSSLKLMNVSINKHSNIIGLEGFENLEELTLSDSNSLEDISPLVGCSNLRILALYRCNSVRYAEVLPKLDRLERLFYENRSLESVTMIPSKNLKLLALGDSTRIEDGDVESLLNFPNLEQVSFSKKKNYKYSALQINEMLRDR